MRSGRSRCLVSIVRQVDVAFVFVPETTLQYVVDTVTRQNVERDKQGMAIVVLLIRRWVEVVSRKPFEKQRRQS